MPPISAISVEGYRCFADHTTLELTPLTLLYGGNNSGKSSLLRLIPMLADSVSQSASVPLETRRVFDEQATLADIIWRNAEISELTVDLEFPPDDSLSIKTASLTMAFDKVARQALVRRVELTDFHGKTILKALHRPASSTQPWTPVQTYEVVARLSQKKPNIESVEFRGLLPTHMGTKKTPWSYLHEQLLRLDGSVLWLRSVRGPLERYSKEQGAPPLLLESTGQGTSQVLRYRSDIAEAVSGWYEKHFTRRLEVRHAHENHFRLVLSPTKQASLGIDLVDCGHGLQQVLPVLVAMEMARRRESKGPQILAIEEPEANLHDDAQRWLAEHICQLTSEENPPTVVLETHSQVFMLAVQLAVAQGKLPKECVRIYWVSTDQQGRGHADKITLNARGEPEGRWPINGFADKGQLARELLRKQL